VVLDLVGVLLIIAGVVFAWIGKGAEDGGLQAFKVNVSGKSWLILVVLGAALIVTERSLPDKQQAAPDEQTLDTFETDGAEFDYDRLSLLWDQCGAGDDVSCNDLYAESPADSDWEDYGSTCADRAPAPTEGACPFEEPEVTETTG